MLTLLKLVIKKYLLDNIMKNGKRLGFYLLLNVIVSAGTMWVVFNIGIQRFPDLNIVIPTAVNIQPTTESGENVVITDTDSILPGQLEISLVLGTGDLSSERILIKHIGNQEINMSGWTILDEQGNQFTFPVLTLFNGAAVSVHSRIGTLTVIDLFWGQNEAIWTVGELVKLVEPSGIVHAQYLIP
jgi:hypothetical protein